LGHDVVAGSRDASRSRKVVASLFEQWGPRLATLRSGTNEAAAAAPDLVVVATIWDAAVDTTRDHAAQLDGKVVIAMGNGLERVGKEFHPVLPPEGSLAAAMQAAAPDARVVAAFQHVPAAAFAALDEPLHSDVIVCGDDQAARDVVLDLVATMAELRGFDGGSLANAVGIEAFAAVLLSINVRYHGKGTLRLLGVESDRG
jgi:NADPH-dependent F420 reductase